MLALYDLFINGQFYSNILDRNLKKKGGGSIVSFADQCSVQDMVHIHGSTSYNESAKTWPTKNYTIYYIFRAVRSILLCYYIAKENNPFIKICRYKPPKPSSKSVKQQPNHILQFLYKYNLHETKQQNCNITWSFISFFYTAT